MLATKECKVIIFLLIFLIFITFVKADIVAVNWGVDSNTSGNFHIIGDAVFFPTVPIIGGSEARTPSGQTILSYSSACNIGLVKNFIKEHKVKNSLNYTLDEYNNFTSDLKQQIQSNYVIPNTKEMLNYCNGFISNEKVLIPKKESFFTFWHIVIIIGIMAFIAMVIIANNLDLKKDLKKELKEKLN